MRYIIIKRSGLYTLMLVAGIIILLSVLGVRKIAVDVASQIRHLPIYSVETPNQEQKLALGINCAWGNEDIPQILDTLDSCQIKATFFLVGDWCKKFPESVALIANKGHEIANHSDTHADMPSLNKQRMIDEIENCSKKIEQITGKKPNLFRCPSGAYNDEVIQTAVELGYYPIQWSLDSLDWKGKTVAEMKERIIPKLTYGDILLFHNDTDYTAQALPEIIREIQQKGYEFVTVGELIHQGDYRVDPTGRQHKQ